MAPFLGKLNGSGVTGKNIGFRKFRLSGAADTWFLFSSGYYNSSAHFRTNGNIVASQRNVIFQLNNDGDYIANTALNVPVNGSNYNSFVFNKTADVGVICAYNEAYAGDAMKTAYVPLSSSNGSSITIISGPSGDGYSAGAFIDNSGNLYRSCQSPQSGSSPRDGHFHKINSSGTTQWSLKFPSVNPHNANTRNVGQAAVDSSGNVYLPIYAYSSDVSVGTLAKYNSSGTLQWNYYYGDTKTVPDALFIDSSNNIYFLIGTGTYGQTPFWLVKIDSSGNIVFQQKYDLSGSSGPYNFGGGRVRYIDGSGNMYITVSWSTSGNYSRLTVLKINSSGTVLWANTFDGGYGWGASSFDINTSFPDYYIMSGFYGNVSLGGYGAYIFKGRTDGVISGGGSFGGNYTMSNTGLSVTAVSGTISRTSRGVSGTTPESLSSSNGTLSTSSSTVTTTYRL